MTDQEKVIKLLKELGIEFEVNGNTIYIDSSECDGAEEFGISFWDGEDYPEGSYHEFWVAPEQQIICQDEAITAFQEGYKMGLADAKVIQEQNDSKP